ncbi:MAG: fatty acid desaturase, partial [Myxococcota bacterium]
MKRSITPQEFANYRTKGLWIAGAIVVLWGMAVTLGLAGAYPGAGWWVADLLWVGVETLAYTGMFITAHDAMHGLVAPQHPRLNHAVGALAIGLFA